MKRLATMAATTVLAIGTLTACGGGDEYCDQIKDAQGEFSGLETADLTVDDMKSMSDKVADIADSAPEDISAEWESLGSAVDGMVDALDEAGVATDKPLQEAVTEAVGSDQEMAQELGEKLQSFQDAQSDVEAVQKNAKEECDIELGDDSE